jgi:anti-sigma B factor antagonist
MPQFQILREKLPNGVMLVQVKGFLDAYTYEEFEKTIQELFDGNSYKIVVDLSELQYISSAGAGVFIGAIGQAQENNGNIVILRPTANVKEVFELLGLSQIFTFSNTKEEALKAFK